MQQLINFLLKNKHFLLFLLLLFISILFTIQSHAFHKSKFVNSANFVSGGFYEKFSNINDYLSLKEENEKLVEENSRLRKLLVNTEILKEDFSISNNQNYSVYPANVIKNSYTKKNNYLTINKGTKDGIEEDQGVISSKGIVGIIRNTSSGYATVFSILNSGGSKINVRVKNSGHTATVFWNGDDPNLVQLKDLPKLAPIKVGDTIETSTHSSIFPAGIPVGVISKYDLEKGSNYYKVSVSLFDDMTSLKHVYIIKNNDRKEIIQLENDVNE